MSMGAFKAAIDVYISYSLNLVGFYPVLLQYSRHRSAPPGICNSGNPILILWFDLRVSRMHETA